MYGRHNKGLIAAVRVRMQSPSGFTLVEMLIATFILGIVTMAAFNFYQNQHQQYIRQTDAADAQQNIRVTMNELARQIRQAGYKAFGQDPVEISAGNDTLLVRCSDGATVHEQLFYVETDTLTGRGYLMTKLDAQAPEVYAEGIDSIRFNGGGTGSGIKWVTVNIVASSEHEAVDGAAGKEVGHLHRRLSSTVKLRNR